MTRRAIACKKKPRHLTAGDSQYFARLASGFFPEFLAFGDYEV
jgi:hypothetical protein